MRELAWQDAEYKRLRERLLELAVPTNDLDEDAAAAAKTEVAERKKVAAAQRSLLALVVQTEERKVILALERILKQNGREMAVLIHDGGLVRKREGEQNSPRTSCGAARTGSRPRRATP